MCADEICLIDCGLHGHCDANGGCTCQQGWTGPNCKDPQCPDNCSGHGQCTFVSVHSPGQCVCDYGFGGGNCGRTALYSSLQKCANNCNGNGLCFDGKCACNVGFRGVDCSEAVCADEQKVGPRCDLPRCPNDCDGKGLCMNGKCACWVGYFGRDCSIPANCYETCANVCEVDTRSEKCLYCVGQCTTVADHPVLGHHDPFEDIVTLQEKAQPPPEKEDQNRTKKHNHHHREVYVQNLDADEEAPAPVTPRRLHSHKEVYVEDEDAPQPRHKEIALVDVTQKVLSMGSHLLHAITR